jgi:hypothetical protein
MNVHVFDSTEQIQRYIDCVGAYETALNFSNVFCLPGGAQTFMIRDKENVTLLMECLDARGCDVHYQFRGSCAFFGTEQVRVIAIFGILLSVGLMLGGIALFVANGALKLKAKKVVIAIILSCVLAGIFGILTWVAILLQCNTDALALDFDGLAKLTQVGVQVQLMFMLFVHFLLLYQWAFAVYLINENEKSFRIISVVLVSLAVVVVLITATSIGVVFWRMDISSLEAYLRDLSTRNIVTLALYLLTYVIELVLCVIFIVYAYRILGSDKGRSKNRRMGIRLLLILVVMVSMILISLGVSLYYISVRGDVFTLGLMYFPGGTAFTSEAFGVAFFVFVYLAPLLVPLYVVLGTICAGFCDSKKKKKKKKNADSPTESILTGGTKHKTKVSRTKTLSKTVGEQSDSKSTPLLADVEESKYDL